MNEFDKAMEDVLDYGMKAIDNLSPADLAKLEEIFAEVK